MPMQGVIMISVPVTDQARALAFYVGQLGLTIAQLDYCATGVGRVYVKASGTTLSLVTWLEAMPPGSLRGVVFRSSDLEADYERLAAAGVDFDGPPFAGPDGIRQAVFHDPDGNTLVLQG
jgi:predicted enzyme related to lactoylglutathione lyase